MPSDRPLDDFAPPFVPDGYTPEETAVLGPFFTNLDQSVCSPLIGAPELIGALCSRASRAAGDLRKIFLNEYVLPFLKPTREPKDTDESWTEKERYAAELGAFIEFLQAHSILDIFANPRARKFYATWLAAYGDDSIAQMAGSHLVFSALSQIAIKHLEDQRIGLAPIEKSTRYVSYGEKIAGRYRYYTDPTLADLNLKENYERALDCLFDAYKSLQIDLIVWLSRRYPSEKAAVIEKKAFDTLRGLLPVATLSQVAFFGNGQAWEYAASRSGAHRLGEIRWAGRQILEQVHVVTPAFVRRLKDETRAELVAAYQEFLAGRRHRVAPLAAQALLNLVAAATEPSVKIVEYQPDGELQVIAGMLFDTPNNHQTWEETLTRVRRMSSADRERIVEACLAGRTERWQKVGRAFENTFVRWEIVMNIGAWRDLHRHRMLTQQRQNFTVHHGYDVPAELEEAGLADKFRAAIEPVEAIHHQIARHDLELAQYAVTLAHRIRFMQWENLRQSFWQIELRTIPEGHPDYRRIEQAKFKELERIYPLLAKHIRVNLGEYDFARRGQEEKIQTKLQQLTP